MARELIAEDESEDDFDWEEVAVPVDGQFVNARDSLMAGPSTPERSNIEITLQARPKKDETAKKRAAALYAQRVARLNSHKMHTIFLLGNASVRNKWANDELLKARLLSLIPMSLQNSFAMIHKSRVPEAVKRGRMFEASITRLVEWWYKSFKVLPTGHIRNRTFEDVQKALDAKAADKKGKGRAKDTDDEDEDEEDGEVIRSEKSMMKHALMRRGSRDISAQLFTSLCRALGIPARLVVSLQSVPWQAGVGKDKSPTKKKPKADEKAEQSGNGVEDDEDGDMEEVNIPSKPDRLFPGAGQTMNGSGASASASSSKGKQKATPTITLRKSRGRKLGRAPPPPKPKRELTPDPTQTAPVFWTEVFSRADARWMPVDPVRFIVNKRKLFDPSSNFNNPAGMRIENRMVYVVAFEEDGYARDVTPRYATEFGAKVAKVQQGGKGKQDWWERVMAIVRRPYRLNRDDLEDDELHVNQMTEQMPNSMAGFKNHPLYVLARHLKRDEVIHPLVELGKFRGEPVYPRTSVVTLKTAENWMRQGRKVREGCQPMKWVKQHAVTVNKKRAIEMALADRSEGLVVAGEDQGQGFSNEKDAMQGMYAEGQTELYVPLPVVDGKIPKNDFGNIDLYVPSMLPEGAAFIPYKGAAKLARQLGFDYAEAVTGFEFKKRRAFPVIGGVVVSAENEQTLLEAYWAAEQEAEEKRRSKKQEQVIRRWKRLVHGLRIRQRLQDQYKGKDIPAEQVEADDGGESLQEAGGFMNTANNVVQHYSLPRNLHEVLESPSAARVAEQKRASPLQFASQDHSSNLASGAEIWTDETFDIEHNLDKFEPHAEGLSSSHCIPNQHAIPKTMRELADLAEDAAGEQKSDADEDVEVIVAQPLSTPASNRIGGRSIRSKTGTPRTSNDNAGSFTPTLSARGRGRKRNREELVPDSESEGIEEADFELNSPAKRARPSKAPVPVPRSDRVLRTRKPKTAEQLQEEKEQETAYRRAIT